MFATSDKRSKHFVKISVVVGVEQGTAQLNKNTENRADNFCSVFLFWFLKFLSICSNRHKTIVAFEHKLWYNYLNIIESVVFYVWLLRQNEKAPRKLWIHAKRCCTASEHQTGAVQQIRNRQTWLTDKASCVVIKNLQSINRLYFRRFKKQKDMQIILQYR